MPTDRGNPLVWIYFCLKRLLSVKLIKAMFFMKNLQLQYNMSSTMPRLISILIHSIITYYALSALPLPSKNRNQDILISYCCMENVYHLWTNPQYETKVLNCSNNLHLSWLTSNYAWLIWNMFVDFWGRFFLFPTPVCKEKEKKILLK